MNFTFTVNVQVERIQGKFATRDELEEAMLDAIDSANPGSLEGDEGGEYEITDWIVEAEQQVKKGKKVAS